MRGAGNRGSAREPVGAPRRGSARAPAGVAHHGSAWTRVVLVALLVCVATSTATSQLEALAPYRRAREPTGWAGALQADDGAWPPIEPALAEHAELRLGTTALVSWSFLASDWTLDRSEAVRRGVESVAAQLAALEDDADPLPRLLATIVLADVAHRTGAEPWRTHALDALETAVSRAEPDGRWRSPRSPHATAWAALALVVATADAPDTWHRRDDSAPPLLDDRDGLRAAAHRTLDLLRAAWDSADGLHGPPADEQGDPRPGSAGGEDAANSSPDELTWIASGAVLALAPSTRPPDLLAPRRHERLAAVIEELAGAEVVDMEAVFWTGLLANGMSRAGRTPGGPRTGDAQRTWDEPLGELSTEWAKADPSEPRPSALPAVTSPLGSSVDAAALACVAATVYYRYDGWFHEGVELPGATDAPDAGDR